MSSTKPDSKVPPADYTGRWWRADWYPGAAGGARWEQCLVQIERGYLGGDPVVDDGRWLAPLTPPDVVDQLRRDLAARTAQLKEAYALIRTLQGGIEDGHG